MTATIGSCIAAAFKAFVAGAWGLFWKELSVAVAKWGVKTVMDHFKAYCDRHFEPSSAHA